MNAAQRHRYRILAELELSRGNTLAALLLDALDELDTPLDMRIPEPTVEPDYARGNAIAARLLNDDFDDPSMPPTPPSTVAQPEHDLDFGPGGDILTDLGPEPNIGGHGFRDRPPTT